MRELIITDLTKFSNDTIVCIAAIDVNTGECLRPLPYIETAKCQELGIFPGAILKGDITLQADRKNPHIEDADYSHLKFHGICSEKQFIQILENSLKESVSSGFGIEFDTNQKHIPIDEKANCSIITIKIHSKQFKIHPDLYKPGKIRATFIDNSKHTYKQLSITDKKFQDYAKKYQDTNYLNTISSIIYKRDFIYLRIGLSRKYEAGDRHGYWLQINGIYTFPDFYKEIGKHE